MNKKFVICIFTAIFPMGPAALQALLIPGITATTDMYYANGTSVTNIVNGSGLPGNTPALTGTHASANAANVWASGYKYGSVIFNLHGLYQLNGVSIWPFNGNNTICARDVQWLVSTDGTHFTPMSEAPTLLPQGPWTSPVAPTCYLLSGVQATHVRLDIYSNYGHTSSSGFAEIQFDGDFVPVLPPDIDLAEVAHLSAWWGLCTCSANNAFCDGADYNHSGCVDLIDLCLLVQNWLE